MIRDALTARILKRRASARSTLVFFWSRWITQGIPLPVRSIAMNRLAHVARAVKEARRWHILLESVVP